MFVFEVLRHRYLGSIRPYIGAEFRITSILKYYLLYRHILGISRYISTVRKL